MDRVIGRGSFAIVFQASNIDSGEVVAIKKVQITTKYKNRELQLLKEIAHPNVIELKHAFYTQKEEGVSCFSCLSAYSQMSYT